MPRRLRGISTTALVAPILPFLNDGERQLKERLRA
jgi:DNA repair photolyase